MPFFSRHAAPCFAGHGTLATVEAPWLLLVLDDAIREAAAMNTEARRVRADARAACEWAKLAASDAKRAVVQARRPWRARVS